MKALGQQEEESEESGPTFSVSSFFTDLRLARRSMETLCLEPSKARSMASAETRTRRRGGRLNFPRRSRTFSFRSLICRQEGARLYGGDARPGPLFLGIQLLGFQLETYPKFPRLHARFSEVLRTTYPFPNSHHELSQI